MKFIHSLKAASTRFLRDRSGASAIEYGLIAAAIAVVIMTAVGNIGTNLSGKFSDVANKLAGTQTTTPSQ